MLHCTAAYDLLRRQKVCCTPWVSGGMLVRQTPDRSTGISPDLPSSWWSSTLGVQHPACEQADPCRDPCLPHAVLHPLTLYDTQHDAQHVSMHAAAICREHCTLSRQGPHESSKARKKGCCSNHPAGCYWVDVLQHHRHTVCSDARPALTRCPSSRAPPCIPGKQSWLPCRPLAAASAKVLSALAARGGVIAEIALSEGSAATLALRLLQQSLQWLPSIPGRETSLYIAQALTALAASGQHTLCNACEGALQACTLVKPSQYRQPHVSIVSTCRPSIV